MHPLPIPADAAAHQATCPRSATRVLARRVTCAVLAASLALPAWAQPAGPGGLVSTERLAATLQPAGVSQEGQAARATLLAALDRSEVAEALANRGLSVEQARDRVAALTDAEALQLAQRIDDAPAGQGEIISTIVFIFVLLLITDILGFTKIFPFTRSIR